MSKVSFARENIVKPGTRDWGSVAGGSFSANIYQMRKENNDEMHALYQQCKF